MPTARRYRSGGAPYSAGCRAGSPAVCLYAEPSGGCLNVWRLIKKQKGQVSRTAPSTPASWARTCGKTVRWAQLADDETDYDVDDDERDQEDGQGPVLGGPVEK